ncbi:MAG: hypothetical protein JWP97_4106 [Labilithrix sp.]|nr:hypothetical protein [Labilithrix sp.]
MGSQLELRLQRSRRGGARRNAGRPAGPEGTRRTPHRARPRLSCHTPVHITLRAAKGLPSLRSERMARAVGAAIQAMKGARDDFRVVELSIQTNHVHLIVEADDARALSSGIRSLQARVTRRLNDHVLRRKRGKIWCDRYFRVDLTSPRQARRALVYVLQNGHHHGVVPPGQRDPLSSAPWSTRFVQRPELPAETSPCSPSLTFMLNKLWERQWPGLILPSEVPSG